MNVQRRTLSLIALLALWLCSDAFAPINHPHKVLHQLPNKLRVAPQLHARSQTAKRIVGRSGSSLSSFSDSVTDFATSLFRYQGPVPLVQAFGINAILFTLLQSKLNTMLTPSGFTSSLLLGTGLWATLGWRGWTLCVLYLFLGQAVTKVRFEDKEKRGIAEGRGGRRGPENVWYVRGHFVLLSLANKLDG